VSSKPGSIRRLVSFEGETDLSVGDLKSNKFIIKLRIYTIDYTLYYNLNFRI